MEQQATHRKSRLVVQWIAFFVFLCLSRGVSCTNGVQERISDPREQPQRATPDSPPTTDTSTSPTTATTLPSMNRIKEYFDNRHNNGPQISGLMTRVKQRFRRPRVVWPRLHNISPAMAGHRRASVRHRGGDPRHRTRGISQGYPSPQTGLRRGRHQANGGKEHSASEEQGQSPQVKTGAAPGQSGSDYGPGDDNNNNVSVRINAVKNPRANSGTRWVRLRPYRPRVVYPNRVMFYPRRYTPTVQHIQPRAQADPRTTEALAMLTQRLSRMEARMARLKEAVTMQGAAHITSARRLEAMLAEQAEQIADNGKDTQTILGNLQYCCGRSLRRGGAQASHHPGADPSSVANPRRPQEIKRGLTPSLRYTNRNLPGLQEVEDKQDDNEDGAQLEHRNDSYVEDSSLQDDGFGKTKSPAFKQRMVIHDSESDNNDTDTAEVYDEHGHGNENSDRLKNTITNTETPMTPRFKQYKVKNEDDADNNYTAVIEEYDESEQPSSINENTDKVADTAETPTTYRFKQYKVINESDANNNNTEVIEEYDEFEQPSFTTTNGNKLGHTTETPTLAGFKQYKIISEGDASNNYTEVIEEYDDEDGEEQLDSKENGNGLGTTTPTTEIPASSITPRGIDGYAAAYRLNSDLIHRTVRSSPRSPSDSQQQSPEEETKTPARNDGGEHGSDIISSKESTPSEADSARRVNDKATEVYNGPTLPSISEQPQTSDNDTTEPSTERITDADKTPSDNTTVPVKNSTAESTLGNADSHEASTHFGETTSEPLILTPLPQVNQDAKPTSPEPAPDGSTLSMDTKKGPLKVDFLTGHIQNDGMSGVTWIVRPSKPGIPQRPRPRSRRSAGLSVSPRIPPGPETLDCDMQAVIKFTFTPPENPDKASSRQSRIRGYHRSRRYQWDESKKEEKEEEDEEEEKEEEGRGGEGRRKLVLNLEFRRPEGWVFNLGDSAANNGFSGDGYVQENDCEAQGHGTKFAVYASDKHPDGREKLLRLDEDFLADSVSNVTLVVSDESLRWDNHHGNAGSLEQHPSLFALSGQSDEQGSVNYDVFLGVNRVIDGHYRSGTGLCRMSAEWVNE
ncbi:uncharacterized protein LOC143293495 [Babylonia areolata]|uniref:uncharacterized protein LOC143293495 n=1 Tax=Babylonia areolata TaxID=304850 RepID=UPI003FCF96C1